LGKFVKTANGRGLDTVHKETMDAMQAGTDISRDGPSKRKMKQFPERFGGRGGVGGGGGGGGAGGSAALGRAMGAGIGGGASAAY
jgi:hypothetical protein